MSLNDLKPGKVGKVVRITGDRAVRKRLLDMGIRAGGEIRMIKAAPLKDPLEISLGNGHISLRRKEASLIQIEPISD